MLSAKTQPLREDCMYSMSIAHEDMLNSLRAIAYAVQVSDDDDHLECHIGYSNVPPQTRSTTQNLHSRLTR